jgi:CBS domain-containing protein
MTLENLVTFNPVSIDEQTPLLEVARMLESAGFHHWPVVDSERRLLGLLSEVDLVNAMQQSMLVDAVVGASSSGADPDWARRTVGELISRKLFTISLAASAGDAMRMMLDKQIHALPVVEDDRLLGMVTSTDIVREISFGNWPVSQMLVTQYATATIEPIEGDASLQAALDQMHSTGAEYLVVTLGERPAGIVSRRQIRKAICREALRERESADSSSRQPPVLALVHSRMFVRPGARICDAAAQMLENQLQAVAVVNQAQRLLGILTEDELLRAVFSNG